MIRIQKKNFNLAHENKKLSKKNAGAMVSFVGIAITMDGSSGVITATSFVGDGSGLDGVASAGLGTALSDTSTSPLNVMYYVNKSLDITDSTTVTVPATSTSNVAYTNYQDIIVADTKDLTISDGDDLLLDVLDLNEV